MLRLHAAVVRRKTGFNSQTDLSKTWAARPTGRCLACNQEIGVRFPGRSTERNGLMVQRDDAALAWRKSEFDSRWVHCIRKVAGYGSPGRFAKPRDSQGHMGSTPMPSACLARW